MKISKPRSQKIPVILASTSPRRDSLMRQIGLKCKIHPPLSEEKMNPGEDPRKFVARLALEKGESVRIPVFQKYGTCLIISADTIVVSPDGKTVLGKPKNPRDARATLKLLSGKTHQVYTGYSICHQIALSSRKTPSSTRVLTRVIRSRVTLRTLSDEVIRKYVSTGEPMDKAGSYGAQGLGTLLVQRIEGSYTNVVGLPIAELAADLEKFDLKLLSWLA